jgi:hypothetical protein
MQPNQNYVDRLVFMLAALVIDREIPLDRLYSLLRRALRCIGTGSQMNVDSLATLIGRSRGMFYTSKDKSRIEQFDPPLCPAIFDWIVGNPGITCGDLAAKFSESEKDMDFRLKWLCDSNKIRIRDLEEEPRRYEAIGRHYEHPDGQSALERVPRAARVSQIARAPSATFGCAVEHLTDEGAEWLRLRILDNVDGIPTHAALVELEETMPAARLLEMPYSLSTAIAASPVTRESCPFTHTVAACCTYCDLTPTPGVWVRPDSARLDAEQQKLFSSKHWPAVCHQIKVLLKEAASIGYGERRMWQVSSGYAPIGL